MSFKIKQFIETTGKDRIINNVLCVKSGVVYLDLDNHFKFEHGNWHQLCGKTWVNLQGGVPVYETNELLDEDLFEPMEAEVL